MKQLKNLVAPSWRKRVWQRYKIAGASITITHGKQGRRSRNKLRHIAEVRIGDNWGSFLYLTVKDVENLMAQCRQFIAEVKAATKPRS